MHEDFINKESDFLGYFQLWQGFKEQQQALSSSQLRNWCKKHFINLTPSIVCWKTPNIFEK